METGDLRRALLTLEPSTVNEGVRTAEVCVLLDDERSRTVSSGADLALLLRSFNVPFLEELQARDAFKLGRMCRAAVYTSSEQLSRMGFVLRNSGIHT